MQEKSKTTPYSLKSVQTRDLPIYRDVQMLFEDVVPYLLHLMYPILHCEKYNKLFLTKQYILSSIMVAYKKLDWL